MSTSQPVVSFAGPLVRATEAMRKGEDLLERRKFAEGIRHLSAAMREIVLAILFVQKHHQRELLEEARKK